MTLYTVFDNEKEEEVDIKLGGKLASRCERDVWVLVEQYARRRLLALSAKG